jgi:hypothetical protein
MKLSVHMMGAALAFSIEMNIEFKKRHMSSMPPAPEVPKLPAGITEIKQFPTSAFCSQFLNTVIEANGTQLKEGGQSCSSTPIGMLPCATKIVQTLIIQPEINQELSAAIDNTVVITSNNLEEGFFNDPNVHYYLVPQTLDSAQNIIQGHQHITVEFLGDPLSPPDPTQFSFFKGINEVAVDAERVQLSATIPAATITKNGIYRICSMSGSSGHQAVVSPVFPRGDENDCIRVSFKDAIEVL